LCKITTCIFPKKAYNNNCQGERNPREKIKCAPIADAVEKPKKDFQKKIKKTLDKISNL
jgi:hypothetical protein